MHLGWRQTAIDVGAMFGRVVKFAAQFAKQRRFSQYPVARHAAIAVVKRTGPLSPRLHIGGNRGYGTRRGDRQIQPGIAVQRLLATAQHLADFFVKGCLDLAPEHTGRTVHIGLEYE